MREPIERNKNYKEEFKMGNRMVGNKAPDFKMMAVTGDAAEFKGYHWRIIVGNGWYYSFIQEILLLYVNRNSCNE